MRQPTVFITTIEEWIINHAAYPGLFIICILILLILLIIPELFSQHLYPFLKRKNSVFNVEGTVNGTALNNPDIYQISIRIKFLSHVENVHISLYETLGFDFLISPLTNIPGFIRENNVTYGFEGINWREGFKVKIEPKLYSYRNL